MIWKARDESPARRRDPAPDRPGEEPTEPEEAATREDARELARQYFEESRRKADELVARRVQEVTALSDSLIARARAVAERSDELIAALDDARQRVQGGDLSEQEPGAPEPEGQPNGTAGGEVDPGVSEGARLLATQMAVAGSTRDEIASRLREEFDIDDVSPILDEIGL
jgi:hypothetical protein